MLKELRRDGLVAQPSVLVQHPSSRRKLRVYSLTVEGRGEAESAYEAVRTDIVMCREVSGAYRKLRVDELTTAFGYDARALSSVLSFVKGGILNTSSLSSIATQPSSEFRFFLNQLRDLSRRLTSYIAGGRMSEEEYGELLEIRDGFELGIGRALRYRSEYSTALRLFNGLLQYALVRKSWDTAAAAMYQIGSILTETDRLGKAIRCYSRCLALSKKAGDRNIVGLTLMGMGGVYYKLGKIKKGLACVRRAVVILKQHGDLQSLAMAYGNLAIFYQSLGKPKTAIELHRESIELRKKTADKQGLAIAYANLGELKQSEGDSDEGIALLEESVRLCHETGNKWLLTFNYCHLANAFISKRDFETARKYVKMALALSEKIGVRDTNVYARIIHAKVMIEKRLWARAFGLLSESATAAKALKNHHLLCLSNLHLGNLEKARGRVGSARKYLSTALDISTRNRLHSLRADVKDALKGLGKSTGEKR
jgi:tetratricopeptide (TPR) repeat protein